jgi:hypothetical protein
MADENEENDLNGDAENGEGKQGKKRREPTLGERVFSWCKAMAVLVPAIIACYAAFFKGEPVAEKTWDTLRAQVNKQSEAINKLQLRIVYFQAQSETQTAMAIQQKLDELQKKYDAALLAKKQAPAPGTAPIAVRPQPPPPPPPPPPAQCRKGYVEAGGKCTKVAPAVLARIEKEKARRTDAEKKLKVELKHRALLEKKAKAQHQQMQKTAPELRALPKGLDDAAKGK